VSNFEKLKAESQEAANAFEEQFTTAGERAFIGLQERFRRGLTIPIYLEMPDGGLNIPGAESVPLYDRPMEAVTRGGLAWLNRGDVAGMPGLTPGLGGMMTIINQVDGREVSRSIVPYLPGEIKRLGLTRL
jgi:hypothetical protein